VLHFDFANIVRCWKQPFRWEKCPLKGRNDDWLCGCYAVTPKIIAKFICLDSAIIKVWLCHLIPWVVGMTKENVDIHRIVAAT
jgi:hypothetical protein